MEYETPEIVVGIVIENEEGRILLIKSKAWGDQWVLPGRFLNFGEKLKDCIRRSVSGIGLRVKNPEFVHAMEELSFQHFERKRHVIALMFCCLKGQGEVELSDKELDFGWFEPERTLDLAISDPTAEFIQRYIAKGLSFGKMPAHLDRRNGDGK
jgi:ADP-ribose pyrophosphatase YjhB (NUDIX family)